jgi:LmbE family N-acetylglucosaminyl deacetylase
MLPVVFGRKAGAPLRLLCLGSHSDDIEIGCGGTVLRLLAECPGSTVNWVVFSSTPEREKEARASAADFLTSAAEATVTVRAFRESYFPYVGAEIKDFFEELKRSVNPDVILCHHRHDLHQDHRVVAELAWNTWRNHIVLEYEIPKYEGDLGTPNVFVPLSRAMADRKIELLMKHFATQASRNWFRPDTFRGVMSVRGVECHAPEGQAEAFHVRKLVV